MKRLFSAALAIIIAAGSMFIFASCSNSNVDGYRTQERDVMTIWQFDAGTDYQEYPYIELAFTAYYFTPTDSYWLHEIVTIEGVYDLLRNHQANAHAEFTLAENIILVQSEYPNLEKAFIRIWHGDYDEGGKTEIIRGVIDVYGETIIWAGQRALEEDDGEFSHILQTNSEEPMYEPEPAPESISPPPVSVASPPPVSITPPPPQSVAPPANQGDVAATSVVQPAGAVWYKILVNQFNRLNSNFSPNLVTLGGSNVRVDARIREPLERMMASCRAAGGTIWAQSGYRDYATQNRLFNNRVAQYTSRGYNQQQAELNASLWIARPGTSEHQSGLAVDFNCITMAFENTVAFRWLRDNAHRYGFILRYPQNATHITRVNYEPWHFRYVGVAHATEIHRRGITLEEYVKWYIS